MRGGSNILQILYSPERNIIIFIVIKYHDIGLVNKISLRWTQYDQIIVFNIQGELIAVRQSQSAELLETLYNYFNSTVSK